MGPSLWVFQELNVSADLHDYQRMGVGQGERLIVKSGEYLAHLGNAGTPHPFRVLEILPKLTHFYDVGRIGRVAAVGRPRERPRERWPASTRCLLDADATGYWRGVPRFPRAVVVTCWRSSANYREVGAR